MFTAEVIQADFRTAPYFHQLKELEEHGLDESRALFWQMRTGKSKLIVDTGCMAWMARKIDAVLVFAPNGVHNNWIETQLRDHHWLTVPRRSFCWDTTRSGDKDYEEEFKSVLWDKSKLCWFSFASATMTRDDVRKLVARIVKHRRILVVFDESHDYRSVDSKRTAFARSVAYRAEMRRILTGTPVDNSPLHAYTQYCLLQEQGHLQGALGFKTFGDFERHFVEYEEQKGRDDRFYKKFKAYKNLGELRYLMSGLASVVLRTDCHDLPDLLPRTRRFELTEEQQRIHDELVDTFLTEIAGGKVSVGEKAKSRLVKLQQVTSGYVVDEHKRVHRIPGRNPRLEAVVDEVIQSSGRVVVWCQFRQELDDVTKALKAAGREVLEYHGRTGNKAKAEARASFDKKYGDGDYGPDLVGQAQSGGSGLELPCDRIIWASHTFDAIVRQQADERGTVMGGKNVPLIDVVANCGPDKYILSKVKNKIDVADGLSRDGLREALLQAKLAA